MEFKPQTVEPKDIPVWFRESLDLTVRHPLLSVCSTALIIFLFAAPTWLSGFLFASTPILFGIGCVIAAAGDDGKSPLAELWHKPLKVWGRLFMLGAYPYLLAIFGAALTTLLPIASSSGLPPEQVSPSFSAGVVMLFALYVWLAAGPFIWFFVPLIANAEMPLGMAAAQAGEAFMLNRFVILLSLALGVVSQLAIILPILVFPFVALVTSLMYVSYRHIWMGRGLNNRAPAKSLLMVPAMAKYHSS